MPSIELTDDQYERFGAIREELAATHAGEYASVQATDVMAYLLDLAEAANGPAPTTGDKATAEATTAQPSDTDGAEAASDDTAATGGGDDEGGADGLGGGPAMLNLLEDHDEKWRETDGDARYEVDLPDGGTETARTRDDVKAILFNHY